MPGPFPVSARRNVSERDETADMEAKQSLDAVLSDLVGIGDDAEAGDEGTAEGVRAKKSSSKARKPERAEADLDEDEDEPVVLTDADEDEDRDGPVLSEDEDDDADGEESDTDEDAEGEDWDDDDTSSADSRKAKALERRNFKLREQKRELEGERESLTAELKGLKDRVRELETLPTGTTPTGPFSEAKTLADVDQKESEIRNYLEWLDDELDDNREVYTLKDAAGNEQDYERKDLRAWRKNARQMLGEAEVARKALARSSDAEAKARKLYPFVFDAGSKRNELVVDLVRETPELNRIPNKAHLLGRLAIGKLVEEGEYVLVKRGAKRSGTAEATSDAKVVKRSSPSSPPARKATGNPANRSRDLVARAAAGDKAAQDEYWMGLVE